VKLTRHSFVSVALLALLLGAPTAALANGRKFDQLNGLWSGKLGETKVERVLTESYPELGGVRLRFLEAGPDEIVTLTKTEIEGTESEDGDDAEFALTLAGETSGIADGLDGEPGASVAPVVSLRTTGQTSGWPGDDRIVGTYRGQRLELRRDMRPKRPIEIEMPGDRPWVRFMQEILIPKTAEDRESYHRFHFPTAARFLRSCQLYQKGYWLKKYMKGDTRSEQEESFTNLMRAMDGEYVSPRSVMYTDFRDGLDENLSDHAREELYGLAASGLGMYFSTAAGGSVRIIVTDDRDSIIYYITDRRRTAKLGLVVMDTPAHAPLASSFGRWLLDFAAMPIEDDVTFARTLLETLAKSSSEGANALSDVGKSAYADYLGVMAIEDQRGVMFNNAGLKWGLNMTNGSFTALLTRALSHGETREGPTVPGREWLGLDGREELDSKVIVSNGWGSDAYELRPGEASYFDTLNGADNVLDPDDGLSGGNDLREGRGPRRLKQLTTDWLRAEHPEAVARVEAAFAAVAPLEDISEPSRAQKDIFHLMADYFYEPEMANLTPEQADEIVAAGVDLFKRVYEGSRELEAFIVESDGVSASEEWAPRASGF